MASVHVTNFGDALDLVCQRHYGRQAGAVEQVLLANPSIAPVAHDLPVGIAITLPDLSSQSAESQLIRLWD